MKITLKKVTIENAKIIQNQVLQHYNYTNFFINNKDYEIYCNNLLFIEVLESIYKNLRVKIESKKSLININLSITQMVILQNCCNSDKILKNADVKQVLQSLSDKINEKLINI